MVHPDQQYEDYEVEEMATHTPGPWRHHAGRIWADDREDGTIVATCGDDNGRIDKGTLRANNRLVVAAPDLLAAAIQACKAYTNNGGVGIVDFSALQGAVFKALGPGVPMP